MIRCSNVTFLDGLNQVCRADGVTYVIVWDNVMFHHAQNGASMVSGPTTIYHPVLTPILSFPKTQIKNVSPHGGGSYDRRPQEQATLLQAMDDSCNDIKADQCQAWIRPKILPKRFGI